MQLRPGQAAPTGPLPSWLRLHKQHAYDVSNAQLSIVKRLLHLISNVSCACEVRGSQQGGQQASVAAWSEYYILLLGKTARIKQGAATHLQATLPTSLGWQVRARAKNHAQPKTHSPPMSSSMQVRARVFAGTILDGAADLASRKCHLACQQYTTIQAAHKHAAG